MANVTGSIRRKKRSWWKNNREFEQVPPEEQLSSVIFKAAQPEEGEWLSPAEIMEDIQKGSLIPMSVKRVRISKNTEKARIPSKHTRIHYHVEDYNQVTAKMPSPCRHLLSQSFRFITKLLTPKL